MNIYILRVHSEDICDPKTERPIRFRLPAGCTVVQKGVCGAYTSAYDWRCTWNAVGLADRELITRADPEELRPIIGSVGVHRYEAPPAHDTLVNTMVDSQLQFVFDTPKPDGSFTIFESGMHAFRGDDDESLLHPSNDTFNWSWEKGNLPLKYFMNLFKSSIIPPPEDLQAKLTQLQVTDETGISKENYEAVKRHFSLRLSDVLREYPGVYYHMSCRVVPPYCQYGALANRAASGKVHNRESENEHTQLAFAVKMGFEQGIDTSVEAATLPHSVFLDVFNQIRKGAGAKSCDPVNGRQTILGFVVRTMMHHNGPPEAYMVEFVDAYRMCHPGTPVGDIYKIFDATAAGIVRRREEAKKGGALGPAKYYHGLSTRRKGQRHREITQRAKMSWKDPKAYRPFATDKGTRRRPSSYSSRFHTKYPGVTGIPAIAKATGVSADTLHKVYNRGMAAWRTGHRPGASPEAWGMARVHSFVLHGKTWRTADKDLAGK